MKNKLFISISKKPGIFGTTIHNAGFKALHLDYKYHAFAVNNLEGAIAGIRALGISGCSISMPFKEEVIKYVDRLDPVAEKIQSVNTIVNKKGMLIGYNTDVYGAIESLKRAKIKKSDNILILGAGGAAKSIYFAIKKLNLKNPIFALRNLKKREQFIKKTKSNFILWENRNNFQTDIVINTTPIGMKPNIRQMPISKITLKKCKTVIDIISTPPTTELIKSARLLNLKTINGTTMAFFQAAKQFELYTNKKPPVKEMEISLKKILGQQND